MKADVADRVRHWESAACQEGLYGYEYDIAEYAYLQSTPISLPASPRGLADP